MSSWPIIVNALIRPTFWDLRREPPAPDREHA